MFWSLSATEVRNCTVTSTTKRTNAHWWLSDVVIEGYVLTWEEAESPQILQCTRAWHKQHRMIYVNLQIFLIAPVLQHQEVHAFGFVLHPFLGQILSQIFWLRISWVTRRAVSTCWHKVGCSKSLEKHAVTGSKKKGISVSSQIATTSPLWIGE